ncbi:MAG: hypothetical protein IKB94_03945 [Clostridia bacterium]|nr:hypothetical protein [Clostridia bacterium]
MAISTINKAHANDDGISNPVVCPVCDKTAGMRLFTAVDTSLVAKLSAEDKDVSFAVCPLCHSVFAVAKNYARERANGTTVIMTEGDLLPLERR